MVDYSKFDAIDVSDDDTKKAVQDRPATEESAKVLKECSNCRKAGARLKCTKCAKVVYCNRDCQVSDWTFHKRICAKPKPAAAEAAAPTPAAAPAPAAAAKAVASTEELHISDDEDAQAIKEASRGYRYFARKLDDHETALIGDIRPKKVDDVVSQPTSTSAVPAVAPAVVSSVPAPVKLDEAAIRSMGSGSSASVWNSAGTFEERDFSAWFKDRLKHLIADQPITADTGVAELVVTGVDDYEGSASVVFLRGAPRRIFDVKFKAVIEVRVKDASLPDAGAAPAAPEATTDKAKPKKVKKKFDNAVPKAILEFHDVSNDADGEYEASLVWGKPAPIDSIKDGVRSAVNGRIKSAVQAAIASVVAEFLAK